MTSTDQSMPETYNDDRYDEEWKIVLSSKGEYVLSKYQAMLLKQEIATGNRATIMFNTFAIPIPYVVEFYMVKRFLKGSFQLPPGASEKTYEPIPADKWEEFKKNINNKLHNEKLPD